MKRLLFVAAAALLLTACSEKPGYVITGSIDKAELNGDTVYLYKYGVRDGGLINKAVVQKGIFILKGVQDAPQLCVIRFDEKTVEPEQGATGDNAPYTATFVLENAKLAVSLSESPSVTGTPENDALSALQKELRQIRTPMEQVMKDVQSKDEAVATAAEQRYEEIEGKASEAAKKYIQNNADKLTSGKLLYDFRYNLDEATRRDIISKAGNVFKSVPGIDRIIDHLAVLEKVGVGKQFTDLEMKTPAGKPIKLSDNVGKGKIVLIDFWASWCPPCRKDIPHLINVYNTYKKKGFEIVGVSLDRTNDAWVKGITDLKITWPQMSDLKYWQSEGAAIYGVNSIPHTVLVGKDGTIIAKDLRGEALDTKLAELFK